MVVVTAFVDAYSYVPKIVDSNRCLVSSQAM